MPYPRSHTADTMHALQAFHELYEQGRAAWPQLALEEATFQAHLQALVDQAQAPLDLHALRGVDLYLACACVSGSTAALAILERDYLAQVPAALYSLRLGEAQAEEVVQQLRVKLLSPPTPKLGDYSGRAALRTFLRASAVNTALHFLDSAEQRKRMDRDEDWFARLPAQGPSGLPGTAGLEAAALQRIDGEKLKDAVHVALQALRPEARNLLRLHFLEGMTLEEIGALRQVHKSTISRELTRVRQALLKEAQRELARRHQLQPEQVQSLVDFVSSQLDLSLTRALEPVPPVPPAPKAP